MSLPKERGTHPRNSVISLDHGERLFMFRLALGGSLLEIDFIYRGRCRLDRVRTVAWGCGRV